MREFGELEHKLFELISMAATVQGCSKFFENCGILTSAEEKFLSLIGQRERVTISEIATELKMTKSAASQFVDKLVEKKYVERKVDTVDRRKAYSSLTILGREIFEKGKNCKDDLIIKFRQEVGVDEHKFIGVMTVIIECLRKHYKEISERH